MTARLNVADPNLAVPHVHLAPHERCVDAETWDRLIAAVRAALAYDRCQGNWGAVQRALAGIVDEEVRADG